LQVLGSEYVNRIVGNVSEMNGVFALVLGLIALLYLASTMGVLGLEVNVVINQHLYPRALLAPFTDAVRLTEADRRAYASYAKAQRHKGFQHVDVTYDDEGDETGSERSSVAGPRHDRITADADASLPHGQVERVSHDPYPGGDPGDA
jgi:hypothetical protein